MKRILCIVALVSMLAGNCWAAPAASGSASGPIVAQGTTSDGSTKIVEYKDSTGATVMSVDTDGGMRKIGQSVLFNGTDERLLKTSPSSFAYGSNLLTNQGFEAVTGTVDDGATDAWTGWTVYTAGGSLAESTVTVRAGSNGVKGVKLTHAGVNNAFVEQTVTVTAGDKIGIHLFAKGAGVSESDGAVIQVFDVTNSVTLIDTYAATYSTDWQVYAKVLTVPVDCAQIKVRCLSSPTDTKVVYFDDVWIGKVYDFSILTWVKRDSAIATVRQYMMGQLTGADDRGWNLRFLGNSETGPPHPDYPGWVMFTATLDGGSVNVSTAYSSTEPLPDTWYLIGISYQVVDNGTSVCNIYINGVLENGYTNWYAPFYQSSAPLVMGATYVSGSEHWYEGEIGRTQFVRGLALSTPQMLYAFQNGIPFSWNNGEVVIDYNWQGFGASFLSDISGNENNLTAEGGVTASSNKGLGASPYIDRSQF